MNQFTDKLSELMFDIIMMNWNPNYIFGLVPFNLAQKGIPVRYGYEHCDYGVWHDPEGTVASEEYLVWMSGTEVLEFLARKKAHGVSSETPLELSGAEKNPPKVAGAVHAA